jgi:hypothetical protein
MSCDIRLNNITINGVALNPNDIILTLVGTEPLGFTLNDDSTVLPRYRRVCIC